MQPGARLGNFEVIAKLGEGGMGEVYRARDTTLHREVAIKVLPDLVVKDPDRMARFAREAQALAALNHPNIAQIHDASAGSYIVMELVDGEDLSETISRGPMPLAEVLPIARQIAQGLEAAHEQGIVHRDLKPANIKVRPDGTVKILDFGLAKAVGPQTASDSQAAMNSPTLTAHATQMGFILGTAAYMSPEQARGKPVDRRADVWAFGVILYEMLTGRRAFEGPEVSDVLASVLKDTLPIESIPADVPASIRRLLKRCLQKDRAERLDSMATARLEIADALVDERERTPATTVAAPAVTARRSWVPTAALVLGAAALAGGVGSTWRPSASGGTDRVVTFSVPVSGDVSGVAVTPDGNTVIIQSDRLYLRSLSDATPRPIPGTDGARNLSLSNDGRWVAFNAGGKLKKVALTGGDPLSIADVDYDSPGSGWGPDNTILFSPGWSSALFSVSADGGGTPKAVSTLDTANGEASHWWPQLLPDRKSIVFTIWMAAAGINDARIGVLDVATGKHRVIGPGAFARHTSSDHLVYFHAGKYFAAKFDLQRMSLAAEPVAVMADVLPHDPLGNREKPWAASENGTLAAVAGPLFPQLQWAWVTQTGSTTTISVPTEQSHNVDLTADGRWLATGHIEGGLYGVWLTDLSRQTHTKLDLPGSNFSPSWSPDGKFFIFTSIRKGHFDLWQYRVDEGRAVPLIEEPFDQNPVAVSNDGKRFILEDSASDGTIRMTYATIDVPATRVLIEGLIPPDEVRFSPDDRWIAAEVRVDGRMQIVVRPFPSGGPAVTITPNGGSRPVWPQKGSRIYYQRGDEVVAVTYSITGGRFSVVSEQALFRLAQPFRLVSVAPDGRFLVGLVVAGHTREARVTLNWFQQLPK